MRANYHTHCDFCDGKASPAAMARAAKAAGYDVLGFSSHAPMATVRSWSVRPERLPLYVAEIGRLKRSWAEGGEDAAAMGSMEILLGLEIDWYPPESRPDNPGFSGLNLDYVLGSVHFIELSGGPAFTVDSKEADFARGLALAGGDAKAAFKDYYLRLSAMIEGGGFDILGHFDLVKKNNAGSRYFDEDSASYLSAAFGAAELLRGRDIVVEVNLGGMARGKTTVPYPSPPIMRRLCELGVPITFSADAHAPEHLGAHLDAARSLAKEAGYASVACLTKGHWIDVGIDET